ncbi:MAG: anti-sigma factor family protein [Geminicoccales bacterium]
MKALLIKFFLWILGDHAKAGHLKKFIESVFLRYFPAQMTCREFEAFIIDYSEDELSERQRQLFDWHMTMCPMCKVQFETYCHTIQLGQNAFEKDDADVPESVKTELINAILASRHTR